MSIEILTNALKQFLLQNIAIQVDQKTIRKGKLKMFTIKQFYCKLTIDIGKGEVRQLELPYPFALNLSSDSRRCVFDYQLHNFVSPTNPVSSKLKFLNSKNSSKFYNNVVNISVIEN